MPCPEHRKTSEQCPLAVCQAAAPYLASDAGVAAPELAGLAVAAVEIAATGALSGNAVLRLERTPPDPGRTLCVEYHALRI